MIRLGLFFGLAVVTGIAFNLLAFGLDPRSFIHRERVQAPPPNDTTSVISSSPHPYVRPGIGQYIVPGEDTCTLEGIREMVSKTKGYYARDYPLGLGWNNMRYIMEASLLHASLLNRTLIIPSFVYARACEHEISICAEFATMVNRGDAIGSDEWRQLPIEEQMGWRMPVGVMVDLTHLRRLHPVITTSEFLQLHGLNNSLEQTDGTFRETAYLGASIAPPFTISIIPNGEFDHGPHGEVVRVDRLAPLPPGVPTNTTRITAVLLQRLEHDAWHTLDFEEVKRILKEAGLRVWEGEDELEHLLEAEGWVLLYTFGGCASSFFHKSVAEPSKEVGRREHLRGFVDEYGAATEDVLLLRGATHGDRPPGDLHFTSEAARNQFDYMVLHDFRPIPSILQTAADVVDRMRIINEGRMWIAAHMRRGDFVRLGWQAGDTLEHQFDRIKASIAHGAKILRNMVKNNVTWTTYNVPNVTASASFSHALPPSEGDKFFLATDERSKQALTYFRENNANLIMDLLTPDDRRMVGWPLLFTDVLGILEQVVMSHAAFFRGYGYSSVDGGVVNLRAAFGMDPRTVQIDW
ncbi:uncharacterized protein EI90DRAFT_2924656 [Cantharellus anzutake]|uniref:uncharacterized protein n=1 Tax=Cantharellus anzutake TaxID=1750568 RepID=UPI0019041903|nr:uncharacterized protein EI90DRAFT_2924656 [Cantharellus anzutake]KAF8329077.1 hypothetical protein EI90DRAFT_2924656 [Cantharellus anzutake]